MELNKLYKVTYEVDGSTYMNTVTGLQLWVWQSRIEKETTSEKIINIEGKKSCKLK